VASWVRPAAGLLAQFPAVSAWVQACVERPAHNMARAIK
jgi:glutathione S-transferase